jgi:hypothetical protein
MAVKYGPSIQERSHLVRRKKLRNSQLFSAALFGDSQILVAPRTIMKHDSKSENQILAGEAERLLGALRINSTKNSALVQNLEKFVSEN